MSSTVSLAISSASRMDAAISMRVEAPALRMITPPAIDAATRLRAMNTRRIWVRTERPNHREFSTRRRHGTAGVRIFCTLTRMDLLLGARPLEHFLLRWHPLG